MGVTAGLFFCAVYYAGANMANGKTRMGFSVLGVAGGELEGRNQILTFAKKSTCNFFGGKCAGRKRLRPLTLTSFFCVIILRANLLRQYRGGLSEFPN